MYKRQALIFYASSLPYYLPPDILLEYFSTALQHVVEYAVLSLLIFRALINSSSKQLRTNALLLAILISTFYGISDEIHQAFVPGRMSTVFDVLFDGIGSVSVVLVKIVYDRIFKSAAQI